MNHEDIPPVAILTHSKPIWFWTYRYYLGTKTGHNDNFTKEMKNKKRWTAVKAQKVTRQ